MKMNKKNGFKRFVVVVLLGKFLLAGSIGYAEYLDRIVAVVEDDVILDSELYQEVASITQKLRAANTKMPPAYIIRKQVLERLIIDKLQRQLAKRSGIRVTEEMLKSSVTDIARQNGMNLQQFKQELGKQKISYESFVESVKSEIVINQLRGREIGSRIKVTDREVDHFLETQGQAGADKIEYRLGHILIAIPEGASSTKIQKARAKAKRIIKDLKAGADFKQKAISFSDGGQALQGGDLGWRTVSQIPTLFVEQTRKLRAGEVADPIRSPSGFHIIKLLEAKGLSNVVHIVTETKARHILIKTNELTNDAEAKKRLVDIKERIANGEKFSVLAKSNSDDTGSALKGGDLGWVEPGALVAAFEKTMNALTIDEISEPIQTQFGWHIIQVLERKEKDNSEDFKRDQIKEEIRKRKIEEETELWLRRLRDEAYVDIHAGTL
jgi:peptidyl-prolyl cis-trans isomerase SurA